ncbi:leukocyte receptor cluster member 9 [Brachionichthys hirsutus]|uniref:leukocyte receptor cluster member 9 n=1 Tax=Brachionichthys hirsutus TaxID=412623 RepID=UPI00360533F7
MASEGSKVPPAESDTGQISAAAPAAESAGQDEDRGDLCQFFLMGKCRFGQKCHFSHGDPSLDDSGAASSDQDDKRCPDEMEKHEKKGNKGKQSKPKHDGKVVNKKPRMRTADDVISRIMWDPSIDGSDFVVGYVDRFLGVLERPFNDFSWDTNPCDCDYASELALPRHRIQYFSCRGHRVWDRHTRTDRVFGSTGQSLAPPFGGEDELKKGLNTEEQEHRQDLKATTEQPPAADGQEEGEREEDTQAEEDGQSETKIPTPESTEPASNMSGDTSQEQQETQGASPTEEATVGPAASTDQPASSQTEGANVEEEDVEEWEESWKGKEHHLSCLGAPGVSQSRSPLEQRQEKRGGRPPRKPPTHFITFRANTPTILSSFQQLQEEVISLLPSSAPHWQTSSSLHVTLCLLVLAGPTEVEAAVEMLQRFAALDRNPPVSLTFPVRLKHFNGRVLYLSPQPQLHLQQLNSGLQEAYRKKGWLHRDSYKPRYHLTLGKTVGREAERVFEGVGDLKVGKGIHFGRLPVNALHLCAMGFKEEKGFYEIVCTVTLR